jgi:hypothetical protein
MQLTAVRWGPEGDKRSRFTAFEKDDAVCLNRHASKLPEASLLSR